MDDSFGPRLLGHFDFTLLFEHTIFYLVPCAILVFVTPFYIHQIFFRHTPLVRPGVLLWAKSTVAAALVGVQIANAVLWARSPVDSRLAEAAAVMAVVSALCITVLMYAGHIYYLRSLSFLGFLLSLTAVLDITTTLTYFDRTGLGTIARLHIAIPCLKVAMIALEEVSKRSLFRPEALESSSFVSREATAGFWNRSVLAWANYILLFGFRGEITQSTMADLGPEYDSKVLYRDFTRQWENGRKNSKLALVKACFRTMPWPFFYIILPRLLSMGFDFAQPFLLQDVVNEVSVDSAPSGNVVKGLILATTIIYVSKAAGPPHIPTLFTQTDQLQISKSWYSTLRNQISVSIRGILISAVYNKSLRLSAETLDGAAAVTLVTADVAGIASLATLSYEAWAQTIEVCLGIAILGAYAGAATIFTAIPVIGESSGLFFLMSCALTAALLYQGPPSPQYGLATE